MKERIKSKLRESKKEPKKVETYKVDDVEADKDEEEYYLGKDRDLERKRKAYVSCNRLQTIRILIIPCYTGRK